MPQRPAARRRVPMTRTRSGAFRELPVCAQNLPEAARQRCCAAGGGPGPAAGLLGRPRAPAQCVALLAFRVAVAPNPRRGRAGGGSIRVQVSSRSGLRGGGPSEVPPLTRGHAADLASDRTRVGAGGPSDSAPLGDSHLTLDFGFKRILAAARP
jgi:hypothetical protein